MNPNYQQKYESNHQPEMNKGTVIKSKPLVLYLWSTVLYWICHQLTRQ